MGWLGSLLGHTPDEGEDLFKAAPATAATPTPKRPAAWTFDAESVGWTYAGDVPTRSHPGTAGLDYSILTTMSRVPQISAIIQTRVNQAADFAYPVPTPYSIGYRCVLRDQSKKPTLKQKARAKELEAVVQRAGGEFQSGGFETFLRMLVRDSLVYDQACFEVIRDRKGAVWGFKAADASTIRRARPSDKELREGRLDNKKTAFVQVIRDKVVNEWGADEMAWCIRRPRTWIGTNGYGFPELEELVKVVTNLLNAETFNAVNFTTGIHASTILALKTQMPAKTFRAFKRSMVAMLSGVRNTRRTPIIQLDPDRKESIEAVNLGKSNTDMEFSNWINWLMKVACAVYAMDPAEIGFVFGNEGQTSTLNTHGPTERIVASRERGLRPLMRSIQSWMTQYVIQPLDPDYLFRFEGFDSLSERDKMTLDGQAIKSYRTVNEIRAEHDLEPLDTPAADIVLDPTFLQAHQADQEGGEGDGVEGEGPDDGAGFGGFGDDAGKPVDADAKKPEGKVRAKPPDDRS